MGILSKLFLETVGKQFFFINFNLSFLSRKEQYLKMKPNALILAFV